MIVLDREEEESQPQSIPLSVEEVAKSVNVDYHTVLYWISSKKLKATKLGKLWRIYPEHLRAFINSGWNTGESAERRTQAS